MNLTPEIVALTQDLIRIPSMHAKPEEIMRCAGFIMNWCEKQGIRAEIIEHQGIPAILVMPDKRKTDILLMTHIDVVDAPKSMFTPHIKDDRLFGRGAIDDKYAAALSLVLFSERLQALRAQGKTQADMVFGLLITGDEETGGEHGAAHALKHLQATYALALDGGSPERIVTREKGVIDLRLTATGKSAHGARPWLGVNAIDVLLEDYSRLQTLFSEQHEGLNESGDHWHKTVNFGKIRAGQSVNQVPQSAEGWFNIRYTENDDPQEIVRQIQASVRSQVDIEEMIPVFASDPHPITEQLLSLTPNADLTREHGASDARHLMDHGIPGVIWGAQGFGTQHSLEECVFIPSITQVVHTLRTLVIHFEEHSL